MEFRKLRIASLPDNLREMQLGETVTVPEGYSVNSVKAAISRFEKKTGRVYISSNKTGKQTITRLK